MQVVDQSFIDRLYGSYQEGLKAGFAETLKGIFPDQRNRSLISKANVAGRQVGQELALMQSPRIVARSRKYSREEASNFQNGELPESFYEFDERDLVDEKKLSQLLDFLIESKDNRTNESLIENFLEILANEIDLDNSDGFLYSNIPFTVKLAPEEFGDLLLSIYPNNKFQTESFIQDPGFYINAPDSQTAEERIEEDFVLVAQEEYSSIRDTATHILTSFGMGLVPKENTVRALRALQAIIIKYRLEADELLEEKRERLKP